MTPDSIQEAFARLRYQRDRRRPPDERRRGQFRAGWEDATQRGKGYSADTLEQLTWRNLGYRFGERFGDQRPEQINGAFDVLAGLYKPTHGDGTAPIGGTGAVPMSRVYEMWNTPPVADYVRALTALGDRVTDDHRSLFRVHYQAPDRTATAKQLAAWAGIGGGWTIVNSLYGKLGHALCDHLGIRPRLIPDDRHRWWSVWSRGWNTPGGFVWQMLPEVAQALEHLGWVSPSEVDPPEESQPVGTLGAGGVYPVAPTDSPDVFEEGGVKFQLHRRKERNREAVRRRKEIALTRLGSLRCEVCDFDFVEVYGALGQGFTECHHTLPVATLEEGHRTRLSELAIVCANCHRMLHRRLMLTIEQLREIVLRRRGESPPHDAIQRSR